MKKLLLLLIFSVSLGYAQNTFQPGYYISNSGIKTTCLIRNIAWKDCPVKFTVMANEGAEPVELSIGEVSEFCVNDMYKFRRYEVQMDRSATIIDKLSTQREPEWHKETVYLRILVEGKLNLMEYEDGNFKKFFYSAGDHAHAEQLLYKEYVENGVIKENSRFRQQLYNMMNDKYSEQKRFTGLLYKKDRLVTLFTDYNGDTGTNISSRQNKGRLNLRVTAEARIVTYTVTSRTQSFATFDLDKKTTVIPGVEAEFILPFNNRKWSVFINPSYQKLETGGKSSAGTPVTVDYTALELPMGARHYFFLSPNSRIYIEAAYVLAKTLGKPVMRMGTNEMELVNGSNFALAGGFAFKDFTLGIRYNFSRGLSNYQFWSMDYKGVGLVAGYTFL